MRDKRRLKILHIDPEKGWGGGESQVVGLVDHLFSWGHHNDIGCDPEGRLFEETVKRGLAPFPMPIRNELDLRPVCSLRERIRRETYDVVHFHTKRAHALALWLGRRRPGTRYVVTRRMDYRLNRNWYNDRLYNRRVDGVVAISEIIARLLVEGGVRREKIRVIHSGVDLARFQTGSPLEVKDGPPVIGTVAVLEERKGHHFLLEAAHLLKERGHHPIYRFAGDGSQRGRLEQMIKRMGLADDVVLTGFVADIPTFLSTVDIFVLPSIKEGLGVAVLEAMAAGKPVIATQVGGIPELVLDGITGLLIPPEDPRSLADAISCLLKRADQGREMGRKGREIVERNFTMEAMARKNEAYYYDLLQDNSL
ncbi:MAG: glycosyltransferase family 4 protein [Deltaproteobacteria bacterium]|nr:glycosyltransferase family 4 protein [Deltaproteobacteria bacterium]